MNKAGRSGALWHRVWARLAQALPLPVLDDVDDAQAAERVLLGAQQLAQLWSEPAAMPERVFRLRVHANRVTSVKLVTGRVKTRGTRAVMEQWLVTGSVDGFVRVWDLAQLGEHAGALDLTAELGEHDAPPPPSPSLDGDVDATVLDPAEDMKRSTKACLVAEVNTGGDVTAIDAQLQGSSLVVAAGSYYGAAACTVYVLDLDRRPRMLDARSALDPAQWCGTQCVALQDGIVAVGTYLGTMYVLHWRTGWRGVVERADRVSAAAVRVCGEHVLAVTRLGAVELLALPTPGADGRQTALTHGEALIARHTIAEGSRPLLSVAVEGGRLVPLALFVADLGGVTHLELSAGAQNPADAFPPRVVGRYPLSGERLVGVALGSTGRRALVVSSLGGVPPRCCVRSYTGGDGAGDADLVPLLATPDVALPEEPRPPSTLPVGLRGSALDSGDESPAVESHFAVRSPTPETHLRAPRSPTPEPRPRSARVDSFSSSTSTSSSGPTAPSRADMLTEVALDEVGGVVCLGSARGAVWVADYGGLLG